MELGSWFLELPARYNTTMYKPPPTPGYVQPYRYPSPHIPMSAIRRLARKIAAKFQPDKIILFGSYAYGMPNNESDVDLLVIMPARNAIDQAIRIEAAFEREFTVDLIVRTPRQMEIGLREGDCDWFLREITEKGRVLYEAPHCPVGAQGRRGSGGSKANRGSAQAKAKRGVLSLSASGREVPQGAAPGSRRRRTSNARSRKSS